MFYAAQDGRWTTLTALRRAAGATGQTIWHGVPGRAYSLMMGNVCLATVRQRGRGRWHVSIEGFEWQITPDMEAARFQAIPGSCDFKFTQVKGFDGSRAGKAAVDRVIKAATEVSYA